MNIRERQRPSGIRQHRRRDRIGGFKRAALLAAIVSVALGSGRVDARTRIANTVHNLTPSGPGEIKEKEAAGLCVFCHTPHNASTTRALWNRDLPAVTYKLYESSTLEAQLNQPTGSSRLCLSCHDGVVALSQIRVATGGPYTLGPLTGRTALGTDLSDDHPISFVYDSDLAARKGQLADPATLPTSVRLDDTHQLQCTTCHDPHEDRHPKFLRTDNRFGAQCVACHQLRNWDDASHSTSSATWNGSGENPWPAGAFPSVGENACVNCHRSHSAGHPQRLLARSEERANCTICHNGRVAQKNIEQEFAKPSHHPIESMQWTHEEKEDPLTMPRHVTCADCHNPHAARSSSAIPPNVSGWLRGVVGVMIDGGRIDEANFEYEVCLKCHGLQEPSTPGITRVEMTRNIRLKINSGNPSYHPIAAPGRNSTITGLMPGYTASSRIYCTDCHNNDSWTGAGLSPRGPHGSGWQSILWQEYENEDPMSESPATYALCYKCHNRTTLLYSGNFPHEKHVLEERASCAVCHDPHGSQQNVHLIDFMTLTKLGSTVVTASSGGRLDFVPGPQAGHGECYLTCHGEDHNPEHY